MARFSGIVYKARLYFSKPQLLQFYTSYVKSVIPHGILVYGNTYKTHLKEIHKFQKSIMRTIYFKKKSEPVREIMKQKNLNVYEIFLYELFKELFQILGRQKRDELLKTEKITNRRVTRSSSKDVQPTVPFYSKS